MRLDFKDLMKFSSLSKVVKKIPLAGAYVNDPGIREEQKRGRRSKDDDLWKGFWRSNFDRTDI